MSVKKRRRSPVIVAPSMLVTGNVIARRITDVSTVPRMPVSNAASEEHIHPSVLRQLSAETISVIERYTTAIPKSTHRKAGVTVMVPVIVSKAVVMPIMTLAITARRVQVHLQKHAELFIDITSALLYAGDAWCVHEF